MNKYWIRNKDGSVLCKNKRVKFVFWSKLKGFEYEAIKMIKPLAIIYLVFVLSISDNECYMEVSK